MGDLDIRKAAEGTADLLAAYVTRLLEVLARPKATFESMFDDLASSSGRFRAALAYAATSILLGVCVASFVGLPNSPSEVSPKTAVAVLLIWIIMGLCLHPFLRLFRARRNIESTLVVFLYTVSTIHLLFIPALALFGRFITETQVVLTYNYVVSFGGSQEGRGYPLMHEIYIKEREPEKEGTMLPPPVDQTVPGMPTAPGGRVPIQGSESKPPQRSESLVVAWDKYFHLLAAIWLAYYLTNSTYLAIGLSVAHRLNMWMLLALAVAAPVVSIAVAVLFLAILLMLW